MHKSQEVYILQLNKGTPLAEQVQTPVKHACTYVQLSMCTIHMCTPPLVRACTLKKWLPWHRKVPGNLVKKTLGTLLQCKLLLVKLHQLTERLKIGTMIRACIHLSGIQSQSMLDYELKLKHLQTRINIYYISIYIYIYTVFGVENFTILSQKNFPFQSREQLDLHELKLKHWQARSNIYIYI